MSTYRYANSDYIRKYLGLTQTKKLIQTFPFHILRTDKSENLIKFVESKNTEELIEYVRIVNGERQNADIKLGR